MSRVLYVPNESFMTQDILDEASKSAIQIQIGDSMHTENLAFDRNKINIVNIEKQDNFNYIKKIIKNFNQNISYKSGKYNFNKTIKCKIHKDNYLNYINPKICEKNFVSFILKCEEVGNYQFSIEFEDSVLLNGDFEVYEL
jgi:hypothetical protein